MPSEKQTPTTALHTFCRLIVVGHVNIVTLYRALRFTMRP
jgi:hypothetical protein